MPMADVELMGDNPNQYPIAEEAQLIQPVPLAPPAQLAQLAPPAPPAQLAQLAPPAQLAPVSMFDLVPGRRYIISNRRVDAWPHPTNQLDSYRPNQSTFVATFICLSRPKSGFTKAPQMKGIHPADFFDGIEFTLKLKLIFRLLQIYALI